MVRWGGDEEMRGESEWCHVLLFSLLLVLIVLIVRPYVVLPCVCLVSVCVLVSERAPVRIYVRVLFAVQNNTYHHARTVRNENISQPRLDNSCADNTRCHAYLF